MSLGKDGPDAPISFLKTKTNESCESKCPWTDCVYPFGFLCRQTELGNYINCKGQNTDNNYTSLWFISALFRKLSIVFSLSAILLNILDDGRDAPGLGLGLRDRMPAQHAQDPEFKKGYGLKAESM